MAPIQFTFPGPQDGSWFLKIRGGQREVQPGTAANPTSTMEADPRVFMDTQEGKLRLNGDLNLAFRVGMFFDLPGVP